MQKFRSSESYVFWWPHIFNLDFPSSSDTLDFTSGEGVYCGLFYISVGLLGALLRYDGLLGALLWFGGLFYISFGLLGPYSGITAF